MSAYDPKQTLVTLRRHASKTRQLGCKSRVIVGVHGGHLARFHTDSDRPRCPAFAVPEAAPYLQRNGGVCAPPFVYPCPYARSQSLHVGR
jgi:hypothetical protein